jgi:hypothetical protein
MIQTYLIALLIIIIIICFIVAIVSVAMIIVYVVNMSRAVKGSLFNKRHCGEIYCKSKIDDTLVIPEITNKFNLNMCRYCADLIVRMELPLYDDNSFNLDNENIKIPKNMKLIGKLYEQDVKYVFGIVLKDTNNTIWISYRGTSDINEWHDDFTYNQSGLPGKKTLYQIPVPFFDKNKLMGLAPKAHNGFIKVYSYFKEKLLKIIKDNKPTNIIITGHSLGAAVGTLTSVDLTINGFENITYVFGSPRVGNKDFSDLVDNKSIPLFRISNTCDIIPTLPFAVSPNLQDPNNSYWYQHCGESYSFTDNWLSTMNNHIMSVHIKWIDTMLKQKTLDF